MWPPQRDVRTNHEQDVTEIAASVRNDSDEQVWFDARTTTDNATDLSPLSSSPIVSSLAEPIDDSSLNASFNPNSTQSTTLFHEASSNSRDIHHSRQPPSHRKVGKDDDDVTT